MLQGCHLVSYRIEMPYAVQTEVFEGPFDVLLRLILDQEVDLYEISLTNIVDAYLTEMERILSGAANDGNNSGVDLELATEFLLIAATLVELKTRRLLPDRTDGDLDEEFGLWEERDLLLSRLLECKTFKTAASIFRQMSHQASFAYSRTAGPEDKFLAIAPDLLGGVTGENLGWALISALTPKMIEKVDLGHVTPVAASVTDAMFEIIEELPVDESVSFKALTDGLVDRIEVVVRFLAILELFKQGQIELSQEQRFGDIILTRLADQVEPFAAAVGSSYDG